MARGGLLAVEEHPLAGSTEVRTAMAAALGCNLAWGLVDAVGVFLLVVLATFPVTVPFMLTNDIALAMQISRAVAVLMLFLAGWSLGRYAGYLRPALTGVFMALIGAVLIAFVQALGG
jgi:VIT1/CCC1 family predicted Fe2+/Mn2+ transporter